MFCAPPRQSCVVPACDAYRYSPACLPVVIWKIPGSPPARLGSTRNGLPKPNPAGPAEAAEAAETAAAARSRVETRASRRTSTSRVFEGAQVPGEETDQTVPNRTAGVQQTWFRYGNGSMAPLMSV